MTSLTFNMNEEKFNENAAHPLQTWQWGEFRKKTGNELKRFDFGQITLHRIPFTPYKIAAFIKGPKPTKKMLGELKEYARKENVIFIKFEPNYQKDEKTIKLLKENGCVPGKTLFTPTTFWIDLTKNEEELLKGFHSKTRYNIRYAERHGVKVKEDNSEKAFKKYLQLTGNTVERQGFYAHSAHYHRLMWECLYTHLVKQGEKPIARLLTASYKGEILTTWIVFVWKNFLYYPYGASTDKHKNVQANSLIMWEAINYGKKLGLKTFDLWGREPGKGFTKFKEGYNPKIIEFLGTWDLPTNFLYWPYRIAEVLRWTLLRTRAKLGLIKPKFK